MKASDVVLGKKYRWTRHDYEGVAIARIEYMTGCWQIELSNMYKDKEGKPSTEGFWIDEGEIAEIENVKQESTSTNTGEAPRTGGPQDGPSSIPFH